MHRDSQLRNTLTCGSVEDHGINPNDRQRIVTTAPEFIGAAI